LVLFIGFGFAQWLSVVEEAGGLQLGTNPAGNPKRKGQAQTSTN
jgi:hypothetical protein